MILGCVQREGGAGPAWLAELGLEVATGTWRGGQVHLGRSERCSSFRSDSLAVVAESGRIRGADASRVADVYRDRGTACLGQLSGRFRFVLHDVTAGIVMAASSTAPPWPLSYWFDSKTAVVCSNLLPILRCPDAPRELDELYLAHFIFGLSAMRGGSTVIRGIRRLGSGEALVVDSGGARVARVDRLAPRYVRGDSAQLGRFFVEELGEAMHASVDDARSVLSLSGGLDSAALAGVGLRRVSSLSALSFVAPALDRTAEMNSIGAMQRAWTGLRLTPIDASGATELPELVHELRDDPALTPLALLPARILLWSKAHDQGFCTVIEGEGGDELFSMLPTPLDSLRSGNVWDAVRRAMALFPRRASVERGLVLPMLPASVQRAWLAWREPIEGHLPAFAAWDVLDGPVVREATSEYLETFAHQPFAKRVSEWLSAPPFVGAVLSRRHVAASFGLDLEWPMLERRVLELVLGLHAANAIEGGPTKPFLRAALAGIVPDEVRLASKDVGLYRALIPRVLTSQRSREVLRDARVRLRLADLVRFERVEAMLDGLAAGRSLTNDALWQLECVVSFADWYASASRNHGVE